MPADIVGTRIYKAGQDAFDIELGPVFANFVLADEINRAPAKVQSALLEVMAERQVSIGGVTHPLPDPFLVLATQNPIESEGVYPLPEAQRDRFLMKVARRLPDRRGGARDRLPDGRPSRRSPSTVLEPGRAAPAAGDGLATSSCTTRWSTTSSGWSSPPATPREHGMDDVARWVSYGASPRASLGLIAAGRALALMRGRDYVLPQDVLDIAADVLRHRLVLSYDALADGVPADHIVKRVLQTVPLPQVAPRQRAGGFGPSTPGGPHGAAASVRRSPGCGPARRSPPAAARPRGHGGRTAA